MAPNTTKSSVGDRNAIPELTVHALVVGLEGEPITPGAEPPELCRTASGCVYYRHGKKPDELKNLRRSDFGLTSCFKLQRPVNRHDPDSQIRTESDCESSDEGGDSQFGMTTSKLHVLEKIDFEVSRLQQEEARRTALATTSLVGTSKPSSLRSSPLDTQAHLRMASVVSDAARALSARSSRDFSSPVSLRKSLPRTPSLQSLDEYDGTKSPPVARLSSPFRAPSPRPVVRPTSGASSRHSGRSSGVDNDIDVGEHKSITGTPERLYRPPEGWNEREMAMSTTAPRVFAGKGRRP